MMEGLGQKKSSMSKNWHQSWVKTLQNVNMWRFLLIPDLLHAFMTLSFNGVKVKEEDFQVDFLREVWLFLFFLHLFSCLSFPLISPPPPHNLVSALPPCISYFPNEVAMLTDRGSGFPGPWERHDSSRNGPRILQVGLPSEWGFSGNQSLLWEQNLVNNARQKKSQHGVMGGEDGRKMFCFVEVTLHPHGIVKSLARQHLCKWHSHS